MTALLLRRRTDLLSLDSIINRLSTHGQHSIGLVTVAIEKIIGTVNRNQDFDNEFRTYANEQEKGGNDRLKG